ncbi:hypothetical protein ACFL5E_02485 [Candidatus Omnitrophota bacterium]
MARVRKIERNPTANLKNCYVVDACFLANKYIPQAYAPNAVERSRIQTCKRWWKEIEEQLSDKKATVYIPDVCIAETFKTLAKKYYDEKDKWFDKWTDYDRARKRLIKDVQIPSKDLKSSNRHVKYHDVPTCRDLIISVDRFYELFLTKNKHVGIIDLIVVATAKYLIDFYGIPKKLVHIVTLDGPLWSGTKKIVELPNAYDPTKPGDSSSRIFRSRLR